MSITASELIDAIRDRITTDAARAENPTDYPLGSDPSDYDGWIAYNPDQSDKRTQFGKPYFDPESWRWFSLLDVAVLASTVWVLFTWDEPGTPNLVYHFRISVQRDSEDDVERVASMCRAHLRLLLAPLDVIRTAPVNDRPGWRNRASRTWISATDVVVENPRFPNYPNPAEIQKRFDRNWHYPGTAREE